MGTAAAVGIGAAIALLRFGTTLLGAAGAVFLAIIGLLVVSNIRARIYPNMIVAPAYAVVLGTTLLATSAHTTLVHVYAGLGYGVALLLVALIWTGGVGMGDVKTGALVGFGVGAGVVYAAPIAIAVFVLLGATTMIRKPRNWRSVALPTWPVWACAATIALLIHGM